MPKVTLQTTQEKITEQTFVDMGMWLTHPNEYNARQLVTLLDEDARLPLITLVNTYWLGGALHNSLKESNAWLQLDQELQDYLAELDQFYNQRNEGIKQEAIFACQLLTDANIPVVMLKGSASLFNGVFKPLSNRFMTDIDLLVPEHELQKANNIFIEAGYSKQIEQDQFVPIGHHHTPGLFREVGGHCCVELHRWVLKQSVSDVLSTEEVWKHVISLELTKELSILQMDPTQQVVLSIAHSELSHACYKNEQIDWRQLHNLYALVNFYENNIDWPSIFEHFNRCNKTPALSAILHSVAKLMGLTTPLTNAKDKAAMRHLSNCIKLFEKRQRPERKFNHFFVVLNNYTKEGISQSYGVNNKHWLLLGRLQLIKRHLSMACSPRYLKLFINRVLN